MDHRSHRQARIPVAVFALCLVFLTPTMAGAEAFGPKDVLNTKIAGSHEISPDGKWIAYTLRIPRKAGDKAGSDYRELHVVSTETGETRPFVTGEVQVYSPQWSPDGSQITFRTKRGDKAKTQVWMIPFDGGEASQITHAKSSVISYRWRPDGKAVAYLATTPATKKEKKLKDKGFGFVFYEENLKHRNLYQIAVDNDGAEAEQLTDDLTVWSFTYAPDGNTIAMGASEKNLIDHRYAFQKVHLLDVATGKTRRLTDNKGKLGNFVFSGDGSRVAYTAARDRADHAVSQAYVIDIKTGKTTNVTPPNFKAHIDWVGWKDNDNVVYRAKEGVRETYNVVKATGGKSQMILSSKKTGVSLGIPTYTKDFKHFATAGSTTEMPWNFYYWQPGKAPKQLTDFNPWVKDRELGRREVIRYPARDGLEIEALLVYPVGYEEGKRYPLIAQVHGGPESNYSNGWLTWYSRADQVLAGRGYFVFLPNYRGSTGYGIEFTKDHMGDPAGKEFDDIADGIDYLIEQGLVDRDRVGLGGGSYGGYAAAWFSSYYTKYVKAVCMFVGISNLISKRSTTDIPYEELYVHSGKMLEDMWDLSLKRSPIYYARQSQSAVLIYGGTADSRVHPSQSLEYYRRLKVNNHPAVRLVQYPGEGHGNSKQPGRIDVLYRTLAWYDWYVKDKKPLDGPMPPLDVSENYGLKFDEEAEPAITSTKK